MFGRTDLDTDGKAALSRYDLLACQREGPPTRRGRQDQDGAAPQLAAKPSGISVVDFSSSMANMEVTSDSSIFDMSLR